MPFIPVDPNHPAASVACRMAGEWTSRAPLHESPPRVAKTKAKVVMHGALIAAAACVDYAAAAGNAALPALSANSNSSSASEDFEMTGGNYAALGGKSTGLTDLTDSPPASPMFSEEDIFCSR
jgi:hypothetical protein